MISTLRLLNAFFVRDLHTELSYRLAFLLNFTSVFFSTLSFFFLSELVGGNNITELQRYNGNYFGFVIVGIAMAGYFTLGLTAFAQALREAQTTGTLEAMMMTPARVSAIIIGSAAWSYAFTTFRVGLYFVLGAFLGLSLWGANLLGALVTLALSIVSFASIGIIAASMIMVIKRGDPITALFGSVSNLIGGILYPVEILPEWLQIIANFLPITYAVRAMRDALLLGSGWDVLAPNLWPLGAFCVILFPLSLFAFRYAVHVARREGTLTHY